MRNADSLIVIDYLRDIASKRRWSLVNHAVLSNRNCWKNRRYMSLYKYRGPIKASAVRQERRELHPADGKRSALSDDKSSHEVAR